jgi:hypothetical protein
MLCQSRARSSVGWKNTWTSSTDSSAAGRVVATRPPRVSQPRRAEIGPGG